MFALVLLYITGFATLLGVAGGIFGLAIWHLCRGRIAPMVPVFFGSLFGVISGYYFGYDGLIISAAAGISWYGGVASNMYSIAMGLCILASVVYLLLRRTGIKRD